MGFMEPEVTDLMTFIETAEGYVPEDHYSEEDHGEATGSTLGYGARLSAPGYRDCTDWIVCNSPREAVGELVLLYCDCEDDGEPCDCCELLEEIKSANREG